MAKKNVQFLNIPDCNGGLWQLNVDDWRYICEKI